MVTIILEKGNGKKLDCVEEDHIRKRRFAVPPMNLKTKKRIYSFSTVTLVEMKTTFLLNISE